MTIPFLEVVLHTTHEVFKNKRTSNIVPEPSVLNVKSGKEEKKEEGAKIMKIKLSKVMGNLMLPICSLVFTIIFWALGLNHAYSSADIQDSNMSDCLTIDLA